MRAALVAMTLALLATRRGAAQDTVRAQLRGMIAQAHHPWAGRADFPRYVDVLARLYASRGDAPGVAAETGVVMLLYLDQAWKHITRDGRAPGLTTRDSEMAGSAYRAMEVIGLAIIVPCCLAALLSGLVQSLGMEWGLFRYYWIMAKLSLTVVATGVLLMHVPAVTRMARPAVSTSLSTGDFRLLRIQLVVHAVGGFLVLLAATTLSVYKPWGRIGTARARTGGEMTAR